MEEVIDFKAVNKYGRNCVMVACSKGDLNRLKELMKKGGSLDVVDNSELSCLHHACRGHNVDVTQYLLEEGMDVDVNERSNIGYSCLHYACFRPIVSLDILEMLLNAGADVNAQNNSGTTPFMLICMYGGSEAIKMILDGGADWRMKNKGGENGLDFARSYNKKEVKWLEEYINKLEKSEENCKTATITVLCVGKRKEEMKTLKLNKDVISIIAKMLWETRREVEVWGK